MKKGLLILTALLTFMLCIPCQANSTMVLRYYVIINNIEHIKFVPDVKDTDYIDVSNKADGTCRAWMDGDVLYVGPDTYGKVDWYNLTGDCGSNFLYKCTSLVSVDVEWLDVSSATDMSYAFNECFNLQEITGLEYWDTSNVITMQSMFAMGNPYVHNGSCSGLVYKENDEWYCRTCGYIGEWEQSGYTDNAAITDLSGINNWDVSNVRIMSAMFYGDRYLQNIDLSNWDTGNVTSFCHMFCRCDLNDEIVKTFENWDIHSADNIDAMFVRGQFTTFDMSNWDTSNCINMAEVFGYCNNLTYINFGDIDTSNCQTFEAFFIGCTSLQTLDLTAFDTSGVPEGNGTVSGSGYIDNEYGFIEMFSGCYNLYEVAVSNKWNITPGMTQENMWSNCATNTVIIF